jgi:predicted nucleotidyltransferase
MSIQAQISKFVDGIVQEFRPDRVILFGSYSNGTQTSDSDVDLLVELPNAKGGLLEVSQIVRKLKPAFPVDLIVHTPRQVRTRIGQGDFFLRNIVSKGKVVYERNRSA